MSNENPFRCPLCGIDISKTETSYPDASKKLFNKFSPRVQEHLRRVSKVIRKALPSESEEKNMYWFLYGIQLENPETIIKMIDEYIDNGYHYKGKGFAYLRVMINKYGKNFDKMTEYEKKRIGTSPIAKEWKGNKDGI